MDHDILRTAAAGFGDRSFDRRIVAHGRGVDSEDVAIERQDPRIGRGIGIEDR